MKTKQEIFTLLGGRVKMYRSTYNPTSDAVWLAAFAPHNVKTILDVGIGTGGVSLCLATHIPNVKITGLDTSSTMLEVCSKNATLNDLDIELLNQDIYTWKTNRTFDLVITNPPYFRGTPAHHNAHHNADFGTWLEKSISRVRPMGTFCMITDASTMADAVFHMNKKLGSITIIPLFGAKNIAERVLLSGQLGSKGITRLHIGYPMNYEPVLRDGLTITDNLSKLMRK